MCILLNLLFEWLNKLGQIQLCVEQLTYQETNEYKSGGGLAMCGYLTDPVQPWLSYKLCLYLLVESLRAFLKLFENVLENFTHGQDIAAQQSSAVITLSVHQSISNPKYYSLNINYCQHMLLRNFFSFFLIFVSSNKFPAQSADTDPS